VSLYANWLAEVAARKLLRAAPARSTAHAAARATEERMAGLSGAP
jgi:hypothetical protein